MHNYAYVYPFLEKIVGAIFGHLLKTHGIAQEHFPVKSPFHYDCAR
jgi:hypothetical protein